MKDPDQREFMPEDNEMNEGRNVNPEKDMSGNWDEKAHMSRSLEKNTPHNERRYLNADREKRHGSNLNPDRNSGDR